MVESKENNTPAISTPDDDKKEKASFPQIIHQIWLDVTNPVDWQLSAESWQRLHPEWQYVLWTDGMIRSLLQRSYPQYLLMYDGLKSGVDKLEMARCVVLHHKGGIYADFSLFVTTALDSILDTHNKKNVDVILTPNASNTLMVSKKNAPFWFTVLKTLQTRIQSSASIRTCLLSQCLKQKNAIKTVISEALAVIHEEKSKKPQQQQVELITALDLHHLCIFRRTATKYRVEFIIFIVLTMIAIAYLWKKLG
jgi:mannosyltransferase OCH1-like enzyme